MTILSGNLKDNKLTNIKEGALKHGAGTKTIQKVSFFSGVLTVASYTLFEMTLNLSKHHAEK